MKSFEIVEEAVNRTRLELKETAHVGGDGPNIHDAFAIFAAKLGEVYQEQKK